MLAVNTSSGRSHGESRDSAGNDNVAGIELYANVEAKFNVQYRFVAKRHIESNN